jgi:gas vesicle protein
MDNDKNSGAFLTGFILGGLVGAVTALLMAPQPGEKTRLQIQERGTELKGQIDNIAQEARGQTEKLATDIREQSKVVKDVVETRLPDENLDLPPSDES